MGRAANRLLTLNLAAGTALCLALGGMAGARPLTLTVTPAAPTWEDSLHLRVEGVVQTSCGAGIMHLATLRRSAQAVDVDLVQDPCDVQTLPLAVPFALEMDLGRMDPGPENTVTVHDLADGGIETARLTVYHAGRLGLDVPAVAVSGAPIEIGVTHLERCFSLDAHVAGSVIEVVYDGVCQLPPFADAVERTPVVVGPLPPGDYEVRLFERFHSVYFEPGDSLNRLPLRVWDAAGCVPADERLCLQRGRFQVSARWRAFDGTTGAAHTAPLAGDEGSGLLWFFAADNIELTVKLVEGCPVNHRWWVFVASSSTVEYEVTVTDTSSGVAHTYSKALGQVPELLADTGAFSCP